MGYCQLSIRQARGACGCACWARGALGTQGAGRWARWAQGARHWARGMQALGLEQARDTEAGGRAGHEGWRAGIRALHGRAVRGRQARGARQAGAGRSRRARHGSGRAAMAEAWACLCVGWVCWLGQLGQ